MTPLNIVLIALDVFIAILWIVDKYCWAKREKDLLNRVMSKHYTEYVLAEDLRKPRKEIKDFPINTDAIPIT